jgi:myo-inositol catabolism protein IolS
MQECKLDDSLRALRLERLDLYPFYFGSDQAFQQPELWAMWEQQEQSEKIRHLGVFIASKGGRLQAREVRGFGAEAALR